MVRQPKLGRKGAGSTDKRSNIAPKLYETHDYHAPPRKFNPCLTRHNLDLPPVLYVQGQSESQHFTKFGKRAGEPVWDMASVDAPAQMSRNGYSSSFDGA